MTTRTRTDLPTGRRKALDLALLAWAGAVLALTLVPLAPLDASESAASLLRSPLLADALRNLALMAPLGAGLALRGMGVGRVALLGLAFTSAIELAQLGIPGRTASASDVLLNAAGMAGAAIWMKRPRTGRAMASPGVVLASGLPLATACALTGWLLAAYLPATVYDPAWTPRLAWMDTYTGRVLAAHIGERSFPPRAPAPEASALREGLLARESISLQILAGSSPAGLAPLLRINDPEREILLVGVEQTDLVFRIHSRGRELGLESTCLRVPRLLADAAPGQRLDLRIALPQPGLVVVERDGQVPRRVGFGPGAGWRLLISSDPLPPGILRLGDGLWILLLALPLGLRVRARFSALLPAALLAGILGGMPAWAGLAPAAAPEWLAAIAAGVAGLLRDARPRRAQHGRGEVDPITGGDGE